MTTWSGVIFLNIYATHFSTALVTDHDKPAVKSIVILRIQNFNVLTYKNIPINVTKDYPETFFKSKNPKFWP